MSSAKLTLIGMYNYEPNLFKYLEVPSSIDKDILINSILLRGGEFETIYPNPTMTQWAIGIWSRKWNRTITKWAEALEIDYDPLENYDRKEEWTDSSDRKSEDTSEANSKDSSSGTGNSSSLDKISAYNSNLMEPDTSNEASSTNTNISNSEIKNKNNSSSLDNSKHNGRIHGNIGVTTSQQMLQSELDISKWNIYENITDLFLTEFAIAIY